MGQSNTKVGEMEKEWEKRATRVLKGEMLRSGVTPEVLSNLLASEGLKLDGRALSQKINRGSFSFTFFLQCMHVMGIRALDLYLAKSPSFLPHIPEPRVGRGKLIDDEIPPYKRSGVREGSEE